MATATILVPFHQCSGEPVFREARAYSDFLDENGKPFRDYDAQGHIIVPNDAIYPVHATTMLCVTCGARWKKTELSDGSALFETADEIPEPKRSLVSRLFKPA